RRATGGHAARWRPADLGAPPRRRTRYRDTVRCRMARPVGPQRGPPRAAPAVEVTHVARRGALTALAVAAAAAGTTWEVTRRRDSAALDADPHRHVLPAVPIGRPTSLTTDDGTTLHVRDHRPPDPRAAVVFAHGWGMGIRFWHHQLRAL